MRKSWPIVDYDWRFERIDCPSTRVEELGKRCETAKQAQL